MRVVDQFVDRPDQRRLDGRPPVGVRPSAMRSISASVMPASSAGDADVLLPLVLGAASGGDPQDEQLALHGR